MTATPGQAARDVVTAHLQRQLPPEIPFSWDNVSAEDRAVWEDAAQAGIDVFLAGDSVSAESIREALAAQEPHAAPGVHVTVDGTMWLQCFADDPEAENGEIVTPFDPGDSWDFLAGKVREHQAEHGCAAQEPQHAPGFAAWLADQGDALGDGAYTAFDMAAAYGAGQDDPLTVQPADDVKPAPELGDWPAILADVTQQRDDLRELLGEVGVLAANAPEDDGSFAVCEQIAMRIAAADVPAEPHAAPETPAVCCETIRLLRADLADAEAEIGRWPRCPSGCRCRVGTSDADALECGCDGPCTTGWEPQPAPELAAAMRESRLYREALEKIATANTETGRIAKRALDGK